MSDALEIRGGGAVAVDTHTLREVAARVLAARDELEQCAARLGAAQNMLFSQRAYVVMSAASVLSGRLSAVLDDATVMAERLRAAAAIYEVVELDAQHAAALAAGDERAAARIAARRDAIAEEYPDAVGDAALLMFNRAVMWPGQLVRQSTETGFTFGDLWGDAPAVVTGSALGTAAIVGAGIAGFSRWGQLSRDTRLTPRPDHVAVHRVSTGTAAPPTSLAAVAQRIPRGGDARVRVEKYVMPGGAAQYAVYVAGTASMGFGGADPWDSTSNLQLAEREQSDSYRATLEALSAAGAEPGDVVHAVGHSQGAMIASHLALEAPYDTRTLVGFGSPVEADVGPTTLTVSIRHAEDPVAALAGGGHMAPVGASGSIVVERVTDETPNQIDVMRLTHGMQHYAETAVLVDASTDPRVDAVHGALAELSRAERVEVTEYAATRDVSSAPSSGGAAGFRRTS